MAKITVNGMEIEGTPEELTEMLRAFEADKTAEQALALKVGDFAKVIACNSVDFSGEIGDVVEIVEIEEEDEQLPYKTRRLDGKKRLGSWAPENVLTRATDAEIAEAKRAQAEADRVAKWAEINRKPGEIREGDVVTGEHWRTGEKVFGEVDDSGTLVGGNNVIGVRKPDGKYSATKNVTLITPVERRFDRQA